MPKEYVTKAEASKQKLFNSQKYAENENENEPEKTPFAEAPALGNH